MSGTGKRLTGALIVTILVLALVALYILQYTSKWPETVTVSTTPVTKTANLELQTVGAVGEKLDKVHPTWVSYLIRSGGRWIHSTIWQVPAYTTVHVTIDEYDSESGLRNPFLGQVQGTTGGVMVLNGKIVNHINPDSAAHSFAIPQFGVFVPLEGVNEEEAEKKHDFCEEAPCELSQAHNVISFSFKTPGPGNYRWQCFVPCGAGYTFGNGGPMSTLGYMAGIIKVV